MTAETDLLPLPEPVAVKYPDSGLRDDEHALRLWAAHGYDTGGEPLFSAEQLREAVAPLQAEIEALRAERDLFRDETIELVRQNGEWQARAERLAEALRERRDWFEAQAKSISKGNGSSWDLMQVREQRDLCDAALEQEACRG